MSDQQIAEILYPGDISSQTYYCQNGNRHRRIAVMSLWLANHSKDTRTLDALRSTSPVFELEKLVKEAGR